MQGQCSTFSETLPDGAWIDLLDLAYLAAAYPDWASEAMTLEAAVAAFRERGVPALAALADGLQFDPGYFREINPAWEGADDVTCYRGWLMYGIANGQPPSAAAHLRSLGLPEAQYPPEFAWHRYAQLRPRAGAHRWAALDDLFAHGALAAAPLPPLRLGGAGLLSAIARSRSVHDDRSAIRLYEQARLIGAMPAADQQHLADAYLREGLFRPAADLYCNIIGRGEADGWTFRNLVHCAAQLGDIEQVLVELDRAQPHIREDALWDGTVALAADALFKRWSGNARILMAEGEYLRADRYLVESVGYIAAMLERLTPKPAAATEMADKLLILANPQDEEGWQRRVWERGRVLARLGVDYREFDYTDADAVSEELGAAALVVLYRVPALPSVLACLLAARRRGIPCAYESDVVLFAPEQAPSLAEFRGRIGPDEYDELRLGNALQRIAAGFCDFGIAPTERLSASLRERVRSQHALTVGDSLLASRSDFPSDVPPAPRPRLFLRRSSLTHIEAGPGTFGETLLEALRRRPQLELCLCGPVDHDAQLDRYSAQIRHAAPAARPFDHWPLLAQSEINLAMSNGSPEEEYRAELCWAEAAALGVPSLLYLPHGGPAYLAEAAVCAGDPDRWLSALTDLLERPELRRRIAARAQAAVAARYGAESAVRELQGMLVHAFKPLVLQGLVQLPDHDR